jgi:GR25 family glycosyltransferase involved in LPS biosynthesis
MGNLIFKAHVINICGRIDRLHNAIDECDKMNLWVNIVPAVEGYKINHQKIFFDSSSTLSLHENEMGCFLSHLKCLEIIAADKNDEHLHMVIEDDIRFSERFNHIIQKNIDFISQNKGIYLLGGTLYDGLQRKKIHGNIYETGLNTGTWSYMLTASTARKILENAFPVKYPFDLFVTFFDTGLFDLPKRCELGYDSRITTRTRRTHCLG